jgi:drug/metabolite transporter (DMT)-like permease
MVISGAVLLGISHNIDGYSIPLTHFPARAWWAIAYLVVIGSVLTFIAYLYCLQRLPAALASIYAYINPVIAVLLGALYFQEAINGWVVVGGLVTIFGVYVVNRVMWRER